LNNLPNPVLTPISAACAAPSPERALARAVNDRVMVARGALSINVTFLADYVQWAPCP
jgi:hypothetical protein